jgi:hypothetical protein
MGFSRPAFRAAMAVASSDPANPPPVGGRPRAKLEAPEAETEIVKSAIETSTTGVIEGWTADQVVMDSGTRSSIDVRAR